MMLLLLLLFCLLPGQVQAPKRHLRVMLQPQLRASSSSWASLKLGRQLLQATCKVLVHLQQLWPHQPASSRGGKACSGDAWQAAQEAGYAAVRGPQLLLHPEKPP
jgi:hypothetical protein